MLRDPPSGPLFPRGPVAVAPGAVHLPCWLDVRCRQELGRACQEWAEQAGGFRRPRMPRGGVMSVGIACLGWHWSPYRYSRTVDDSDGRPVLPFPDRLGALSRRAVVEAGAVDDSVMASDGGTPPGPTDGYRPDVALLNYYGPTARMGMHVDRDERSPAPVVSLSLGSSCVFRFGTPGTRNRPWNDVLLESGDAFVFGGASRLAYHGVTKILPGTADPCLGLDEGRINITVRQSGLDAA
ncbi:MAG: alpha-ketoglutarate-dependent dioxygenase AlkB [Acidimicrobiales bacterium]